jgi:hypothetical protein
MHFFKLNAALLALIFSVVAGVLFFFVTRAFGHASEFGTPLNFINWFFFWFLGSPRYYLPRSLGDALYVPFSFLQLWLVFLVGIAFARYVFRKNNPRTLKMIIAVLTIALVASFLFLIYSQLWENSNWKAEVNSLGRDQGWYEAREDFQAGKLKKLVIAGDHEEDKFSGTNDGPFEIWNPIYMSSWPYPDRYSVEMEVVGYNLGMRSEYKQSLAHTNNVKSSH